MATTKHHLRRSLRQQRRSLLWQEVEKRSHRIAARAIFLPAYLQATEVVLYRAVHNEVKTDMIWLHAAKEGKRIYFPRVRQEELTLDFVQVGAGATFMAGTYGILEPQGDTCLRVNSNGTLVVFVPGVAFDIRGNRLGWGGGYYDRTLRVFHGAVRVGLAYEFQVLPFLPREEKDEQVDYVITEGRIIDCTAAA